MSGRSSWPRAALDVLGVGCAPRRVTGERPTSARADWPNGKSVTSTALDRGERLVDAGELAQRQRANDDRLGVGGTHRLVSGEHLLGQHERLLGVAEVHRHGGGPLQRQTELAEGVTEADRLLGAALGVGVLAESDLGSGQRSQGAHHAVAIVRLAEPGEARSASASASAMRPVHRRMFASSVCIISSAHVSPTAWRR